MRRVLIVVAAALWFAAQAAESAPRFREVKLANGVRIHYAEDGPTNGSPIIMLHGLSDSWFSFSKVLPLLAGKYRVYALDLRGHGNSDKPVTGYRPRDMAADVIAFMDAQRITKATVMGHSMGSFVAQEVAATAPQRVSRLVLVGSATAPDRFAGFAEFGAAVNELQEPVPAAFARDFQVSTIYKPVGDAFLDRAVQESLKLPARVWRVVVKDLLAMKPATALSKAALPTLLLRGDQDTYAIASEQTALLAMIGTAKLKTYVETGHAPHWERPAEFARDIDRFMAGSW